MGIKQKFFKSKGNMINTCKFYKNCTIIFQIIEKIKSHHLSIIKVQI